MTSKVTYLGELRTSSIHQASGSEILSDAPIDNHGKGEAFSPTDTVANALGSCILTTMAIKANQLEFNMEGASAEVTKTMAADPRRISKIEVRIQMPAADERTRLVLERVAHTCPVHYSLHPDLEKDVTFTWG
ncbi:OsmC family protein [Flavobacterium silvaticum]|uniref:OsmC family protein n=1 Tax=Flavobacterium silvaticum TaxID=1852020 RepID=A0A972FR74_9FLAO|nr:OsmC family protein [Flavobacterium silvaticum]NMH27874.1 OsmC family protein [Flavobacterium silvaticum]